MFFMGPFVEAFTMNQSKEESQANEEGHID